MKELDGNRIIQFGKDQQKSFNIHKVIACVENIIQEYKPNPKATIEREYYIEYEGKKSLCKESYQPNIYSFASLNCLWGAIIGCTNQRQTDNASEDEWWKRRGDAFLKEVNKWFSKEIPKYNCLMEILEEYCPISLKAFKAKKISAIELIMDVIEALSKKD